MRRITIRGTCFASFKGERLEIVSSHPIALTFKRRGRAIEVRALEGARRAPRGTAVIFSGSGETGVSLWERAPRDMHGTVLLSGGLALEELVARDQAAVSIAGDTGSVFSARRARFLADRDASIAFLRDAVVPGAACALDGNVTFHRPDTFPGGFTREHGVKRWDAVAEHTNPQ